MMMPPPRRIQSMSQIQRAPSPSPRHPQGSNAFPWDEINKGSLVPVLQEDLRYILVVVVVVVVVVTTVLRGLTSPFPLQLLDGAAVPRRPPTSAGSPPLPCTTGTTSECCGGVRILSTGSPTATTGAEG
eukprot:CAMPEP_0117676270 /NCGR_PEP_ID=MMETSP0804-20121206/16068_1 /TAXON_ID=1074897 /ORGANISM="Tetraselmis astigmatica, Strain CCMP880" /LENGTH=128 /DNA_ID=CAMNT_0005485367 /DNA_START=870 /DNA_END=1256 /DNA_ORIENTATION=+